MSFLFILCQYKLRFLIMCLTRASSITEELLIPLVMRELIDAITYELYTDSYLHNLVWRYIGIILSICLIFGAIQFATITLWILSEKRAIRNRLHKFYLVQSPSFYDKLEATVPTMRCANSEQFLDILGICSSTIDTILVSYKGPTTTSASLSFGTG